MAREGEAPSDPSGWETLRPTNREGEAPSDPSESSRSITEGGSGGASTLPTQILNRFRFIS